MIDKFLTRRDLLNRGWTGALLTFLPPPDLVKENPFNVRGPSVKLYRVETIIEVEQRDTFQTAMAAATRRKAAAEKAQATKRAAMFAAIESAPAPALPSLTRAELSRRALAQAAVNYLLTELTPYRENLLRETCKRGDVREREWAITQRILTEIGHKNLWLAVECDRLKK